MAALRATPRWTIDTLRMALVLAVGLTIFSVYSARSDSHNQTYHACLYAGSLSQVGTTPPANCGRGMPISWNAVGPQGVPGEPGPQGPQGEPGPQGPAGLTTIVERRTDFTILPFTDQGYISHCDTGQIAVSGGYGGSDMHPGARVEVEHLLNNGWRVSVDNPTANQFSFSVMAYCAVP